MSEQIPNAYDSANLDRSSLNVGNARSGNKKSALIAFIAFAVVIVIIAIVFVLKALTDVESATQDDAEPVTNSAVTQTETNNLASNENFFDSLRARKEREKAEEIARQEKALKQQQAIDNPYQPPVITRTMPEPKQPIEVSQPQPQPRPTAPRQQNRNAEITPEVRKMDSAMMIELGSSGSQNAGARESDKSYDVPAFDNGVASNRGQGALDFLLIHGSSIPCALYTQIISDYEGFVTCRVTQDVYSANGAALLVERGSMVSGRQRVALEQGKSRLFTNWSDIETPRGISIQINSLGAGRLGASGSEAWIDNHFMQRFGGAILLSFIDDALETVKNKATESGSGMSFDNSTSNGSDMASEALKSSINIKPTGYSKIGQRINIIVARDIDMSTVYEFK